LPFVQVILPYPDCSSAQIEILTEFSMLVIEGHHNLLCRSKRTSPVVFSRTAYKYLWHGDLFPFAPSPRKIKKYTSWKRSKVYV